MPRLTARRSSRAGSRAGSSRRSAGCARTAPGCGPVRSPLTAREWEVLDLLCQGLSTEEIADTLVLSAETVRSHVKSVLRKLRVSSRREAIAAAQRLRSGMLSESSAAA